MKYDSAPGAAVDVVLVRHRGSTTHKSAFTPEPQLRGPKVALAAVLIVFRRRAD